MGKFVEFYKGNSDNGIVLDGLCKVSDRVSGYRVVYFLGVDVGS